MHYKIIADSCCDYVQQGEDILSFVTRVPLSIDLDGRTFIDDGTVDCATFLADMAKSRTAPRSACPSPMAFAEIQSNDDNAHFFTPRSMYPKQKGSV